MVFLAKKLKERRMEKGYSLGGVVRLLKARYGICVARSTLCQWENGNYLPSLAALMVLADLYEVEIGYFFQKTN